MLSTHFKDESQACFCKITILIMFQCHNPIMATRWGFTPLVEAYSFRHTELVTHSSEVMWPVWKVRGTIIISPGSFIPVTLFTQLSTSGVSLVKPPGFHLHSDSFLAPKLATAVWVYLMKRTFAYFSFQSKSFSYCQALVQVQVQAPKKEERRILSKGWH